MSTDLIVFDYQGAAVAFDPSAQMWNLNAMHQAAGGLSHKRPHEWMKRDQTQEFVAALARKLPAQGGSLVVTQEGRSGGTWAHWQIAAAYAHYLNPDFYIQWNEWAMERVSAQGLDEGRLAAIEARLAALEGKRSRPARELGAEVLGEGAAEVLAALRQLGGRGQPREILALIPMGRRSTFDMRLLRLVRRGLIRRPCYGVYELSAGAESRGESRAEE